MMTAETRGAKGLESIPADARLWIFQSSRVLEGSALAALEKHLGAFLQDWAAHGKQLFAGFEIRHGRFIIIAVDEKMAAASGCSIDKMMRFVQALDEEYSMDLLDRMKVAYRSGANIEEVKVNEFTQMLKSGEVNEDTIVFNNLTETLEQLQTQWEVPVKQSWHSNLLP